jgi:flagellar biosynthesis/type III secretory pathway M-ring protein FliF/YscJ
MKQTMSDLSILQRVYLGFAILVAVMVASAVLTFRSQSELSGALDQVTQESMPLVLASSQTQISLLSANKWLTDVLTEQDLATAGRSGRAATGQGPGRQDGRQPQAAGGGASPIAGGHDSPRQAGG